MTSFENKEHLPADDLIHEEFEKLLKSKTGDGTTPFNLTNAASKKVADGLNIAIQAHFNHASIFDAASFFFSRDNVGLPGIALYFKVIAQVERNDAYLTSDFLTKRGQHPQVSATAKPPSQFNFGEVSDVLGAFTKTLAIGKVQFQKVSDLYKVARDEGDVHAVDFLANVSRAVSYKINQGAHYVAHLKIVENDKLALKEFDRRIPFENEDLALAAGIESTIPARLNIGSIVRAQAQQTKQFSPSVDAAQSIRARATFNQIV